MKPSVRGSTGISPHTAKKKKSPCIYKGRGSKIIEFQAILAFQQALPSTICCGVLKAERQELAAVYLEAEQQLKLLSSSKFHNPQLNPSCPSVVSTAGADHVQWECNSHVSLNNPISDMMAAYFQGYLWFTEGYASMYIPPDTWHISASQKLTTAPILHPAAPTT